MAGLGAVAVAAAAADTAGAAGAAGAAGTAGTAVAGADAGAGAADAGSVAFWLCEAGRASDTGTEASGPGSDLSACPASAASWGNIQATYIADADYIRQPAGNDACWQRNGKEGGNATNWLLGLKTPSLALSLLYPQKPLASSSLGACGKVVALLAGITWKESHRAIEAQASMTKDVACQKRLKRRAFVGIHLNKQPGPDVQALVA